MNGFATRYGEIVRIMILKLLEDDPAGSIPVMMLADALVDERMRVTRDQVRGHLEWLAEQGLVTLDVEPAIPVAAITTRGGEVARGLVTVAGIIHPRRL